MNPWYGDKIVISNANHHAMKILLLFTFPMVLQGLDTRTNPSQEEENDAIHIASRPTTYSQVWELKSIEGLFTRIKVLELVLMARSGSQEWKIVGD